MKLRIITTQQKSESLAKLADVLTEKLGYKVWRSEKLQSFCVHVQYGDPRCKDWQYDWMKKRGLPGPEFTYSLEEAQQWANQGHTVITRQMINGQDGGGIVVNEPNSEVTAGKVYTKYFKSTAEYRVMLFQDQVVAIYEKRRKKGFPKHMLKTTGNGYVLCASDVNPPPGMKGLAQSFIYMNRSDIKGIDIAVDAQGNMMVLEVNSAPEMGPKMCASVSDLICNTFVEELAGEHA